MKTRLHGTTAISLCSADEERTPDQAQQGKKAGWEARGICASACVCVCVSGHRGLAIFFLLKKSVQEDALCP